MNGDLDYDSDLDFLPDYDGSPSIFVPVSTKGIQTALELSQRIRDRDKQWSVYLNAIALWGMREWFRTRTLSFTLDESHAVILEPAIADGTGAVCHLIANQFRLGLIAVEPEQESEIPIPQSIVDRAALASHFYIPITVYEEQEMIGLSGYLSYNSLMEHLAAALTTDLGNTYLLPKTWLNQEMEQLLLNLSCLEPSAIALPSSARSPWRDRVSDRIHQLLVQPTLNTAQWFQEQVTQLERAFSWTLMPPIAVAGAMRTRSSPSEWTTAQTAELQAILLTLTNQGLELSPEARVAYRELSLGTVDLRLYAIVSLLSPTDITASAVADRPSAEWSLLLILKHQNELTLPDGIQLEVRDLSTMNMIQQLQAEQSIGYLFTEVIGAIEEQFLIVIATNENSSLTLAPIQWQPGAG